MENSSKLTIAVITMNRADQLLNALESCIACKLPDNTEFVIVDNASDDNTQDIIKAFEKRHPEYVFKTQYSSENLGVGGGRSRAFDLASGEYVYFLDDDAVISSESADIFFIEPIKYLEKNKNVASITTKITDTTFKGDRNDSFSAEDIDGRPLIFKYLGTSHFLRKSAFDSPLYFSVQYGSEEYAPSILVQDKGLYHVYFDDIYIIHQPKVNKWITGTANMEYVVSCGTAVAHATKIILYPVVFRPILELAYYRRCKMYLSQYDGAIKKCNSMVKDIVKNNKHRKIKASTVINMYKKFGLTVF